MVLRRCCAVKRKSLMAPANAGGPTSGTPAWTSTMPISPRSHLSQLSRQAGSAFRQFRLHILLLVSRPGCEPLSSWRVAVEQWMIGTQVRTSVLCLWKSALSQSCTKMAQVPCLDKSRFYQFHPRHARRRIVTFEDRAIRLVGCAHAPRGSPRLVLGSQLGPYPLAQVLFGSNPSNRWAGGSRISLKEKRHPQ